MPGSLKRIQSINKHNQAARTNSDISCKKKVKNQQENLKLIPVIHISTADFLQIHRLCLHFSGTDLHPKACEDRVTKHDGALLPAAQRHSVHTLYARQTCIRNIAFVLFDQFCRLKMIINSSIARRQNSETPASVVTSSLSPAVLDCAVLCVDAVEGFHAVDRKHQKS